MTPLSDLQGGGCSATTAPSPGGAVEVEALHAEGAAAAAAASSSARNDG